MRYPKFITAIMLMLTFAYIHSIQQEFFEKAAVLNPSELFKIACVESNVERSEQPLCSRQPIQMKCYDSAMTNPTKNITFCKKDRQLPFTC